MSAPVIQIDEANTSSQTVAQDVTSIVFASVDLPSNTSGLEQSHPVLIGTNSYEKWMRARVVSAATTSLSNFQVVWSSTATTDSSELSSTVPILYGANVTFPGGGPTNLASSYANLPVVGATATITAPANTPGAVTPYWVQQLQVGPGAAGGPLVFPMDYFTLDFVWS